MPAGVWVERAILARPERRYRHFARRAGPLANQFRHQVTWKAGKQLCIQGLGLALRDLEMRRPLDPVEQVQVVRHDAAVEQFLGQPHEGIPGVVDRAQQDRLVEQYRPRSAQTLTSMAKFRVDFLVVIHM